MNIAYNMDCMEGMKRYQDGYFDLAVVDPVYGDVTRGGYMTGKAHGHAKQTQYHNSIWSQEKTAPKLVLCEGVEPMKTALLIVAVILIAAVFACFWISRD